MMLGDTASLVYEDSIMKTISYAWLDTIIEIFFNYSTSYGETSGIR